MKLFSTLIHRLWMLCAVVFGLCGNSLAWNTEDFEGYSYGDGAVIPNGATLGAFKYYASNGKGAYFDASGLYSSKGLFRNYDAANGGFNSTDFSFRRDDFSAFNLNAILLWDAFGGSPNVILKAFRSGVRVHRTVVNPQSYTAGTTFTLNWSDIDSVVISDSTDATGSGADLCTFLDSIVWEAFVLPTVTTGTSSGVGATSATVSGTVNANNTIATDSVQYGTTTSYTTTVVANPGTATGSSATSISATLSGLTPNTTYHYRIKAANTSGTSNGPDATFTTLASPPSVATNAATGVGSTAVTLNGSVNANGVSTAVTFQYGATTSYGTTVTAAQSPVTGSSATAVSIALSGLTPSTTYHYRVVGVSGGGTTNGGDLTFTTSGAAPIATTGTKSGVSSTSATVSGTVNANNANTTDSVQYGLTTGYGTTVVATPATATGTSATSISAILSGLTPNTTYHYQVKAVNATGTSYGDDSTFTTSAIVPTATTGAASSITGTGASIAGTVNANNANTTDSVLYGLTTSYGTGVVATPATATGTSATSISATLSGLTPNTTYHYQVKAVNVAGASYGADQAFTTSAIAPTVTTGTTSSVGSASATVSGTVNANNANTTDSVQYGLTTDYGTTVVAAPATATGISETSISATLNGLTANTTYHYRVKAVNAAGTSYGLDSTFTTTLLPQTIAFGTLAPQTYGTDFVKLTASASSSLPVSYVSANSAVLRISNDTAYLLAADTVTITASQSGSASYLAATSVSQKMTVTKKPLTIATAVASDKVYDGATAATVTGSTLTGLVNSDAVTLILGSATFASKDTGTAKVVTVTGSTLSGAKSGNYSLTEVSGLFADITPKSISVTAAAKSKVYGSSDPALTYTASTLYSGDSYTGVLARAAGDTVGSYAINQGGLTAGSNYSITFTGANLTVTKKPLTIATAVASDKVYDGTTAATVTGSTLTGLVNSDAVTLILGSATFASKDTGTAKVVTVTGSTLSGAKSGNYSLTEVSGLFADITPKSISVTAAAKSKVYGSSDPALTYTASTLYSGDSYTGVLARAAGDTVGSYAINQGDLTAGSNYSIAFTGANLTVTPAALTITANDATKFYGQADPVFTASMTGFVNGETDAVVNGLSLSRTPGSGVGDYPIIPGGATAANYNITYVNGTLTIKASTGISASRRVNVSTALEFHVSRAFARPALGRGRGDLGIAKHDCDDGSCQSVELALPQAAEVVVGIFDNMGTPVIRWSQTMTDADHVMLPRMDDGRRMARLVWNLRSESGSPVPEGVYVWQIKARLKDGTELKEIHKMGVHTPR